MRFLLDASLPRSAGAMLPRFGPEATDVRDLGLRNAPDDVIAAHAQRNQLALVTRDFDFSDIRNYPPADYAGIVVLQLPDDAPQKKGATLCHATKNPSPPSGSGGG